MMTQSIANGPGKLSKALGINLKQNGTSLYGELIWIDDLGIKVQSDDILVSKRVGIDYAGEDAGLPYRFVFSIKKTPHKSKAHNKFLGVNN